MYEAPRLMGIPTVNSVYGGAPTCTMGCAAVSVAVAVAVAVAVTVAAAANVAVAANAVSVVNIA